MDENKIKLAAVIILAAEGLYLKISQSENGKVKTLEFLEQPLDLGFDTFVKKKISFDKIEKICSVLSSYKRIIKSYGISKIRAVASATIGESQNAHYLIDQIKIRTRLNFNVLDDSEEKTHIYMELLRRIDKDTNYRNGTVFMAYIGTSSIGIAVSSGGRIIFSQNIRIGTHKLIELLGKLRDNPDTFYLVLREYLVSFSFSLKSIMPKNKIDYFITCGKELRLISKMCNAEIKEESYLISVEEMKNVFTRIKGLNLDSLSKEFKFLENKTKIIPPFMGIYDMLVDICKTNEITVVPITLMDALEYEILYPGIMKKIIRNFEKDIIYSARTIAQKYLDDEAHAHTVEKFSLKIFDSMKKLHHLTERDRMILQVAAILHDIGKFVNIKKHAKHSYNLIKGSEILGMSEKEIEMVALIGRFHSDSKPDLLKDRLPLDREDRVKVAKMLAILRLGDALDRAHNHKFSTLEVKVKKDSIIILVKSKKEFPLEEWAFSQKSIFFEEVYGIKPVLKKELNYEI